jgi:hypothetical protein
LQKLSVGQLLVRVRQTADAEIVVREHRNICCKRDIADGADFLNKRINMDREGERRSVHFAVEQDHVVQCGDAYCAQLAGRRIYDEQTTRNPVYFRVYTVITKPTSAENKVSKTFCKAKNGLAKNELTKFGGVGCVDADFNVQDSALKGNIIELAIVVPQF